MPPNNVNKLIDKLNDSKSLIDVLIQIESFMDGLDLYVYKNWFDGEIVDGPNIKRYWVSIILKYPFNKMPDPEGGLRLIKHGAKISYKKSYEETPIPIKDPSDYRDGTKKPKMKKEQIWLVDVQIPRRFIEELDDNDLELYADEIELDDVSDARDDDIDTSSDLKNENDDQSEDLEDFDGRP
jgi:hypothetical protein